MPLDPSIPLDAKAPVSDPLSTVGNLLTLQQGTLQTRLLGSQVQGKIAQGQAAQAAIDPTTGQFDPDAYLRNLSAAGPAGAMAAPEAAAQAQTQRQAQIEQATSEAGLSKAQLELSAQRWSKVGEVFGSLLAAKDPKTGQPAALDRDEVVKTLSNDLVGSGMFNDPHSAGLLTSLVQSLPTDPNALRSKLENVYLQADQTGTHLTNLLGTPSAVSTGGQTNIIQPSVINGGVALDASLRNSRTPGERAATVPVYNPDTKTTEYTTSGQLVGDAEPSVGIKRGAAPTGPGLGVAEGASVAAQSAAGQLNALRTSAEKVPETQTALLNIRDALTGFAPGPKADWSYLTGAIAQQLGVAAPKTTTGVAAQEEFNKLATQFINQQVGQLGGTGTDAKLESARHGTPNEFMSKEGITNVTALMLGLNDALAAKNQAAQKWLDAGHGPDTYGKFVSQFNQYFNPRVFQSTYMTPAQRQVMLNNMTKEQREQFQKDTTFAYRAGWLKPPAAAAPGTPAP